VASAIRGSALLLLGSRRGALLERREQPLVELGGPVGLGALILRERLGGQPRGQLGGRGSGKRLPRARERRGPRSGLRDISNQRIDHRRGIAQLIERALELGERCGPAPVGARALPLAELASRLSHALACEVEVVEHAFELGGAHLILRGPFLLRAARNPLTLGIDRARESICVGQKRALLRGARSEIPAQALGIGRLRQLRELAEQAGERRHHLALARGDLLQLCVDTLRVALCDRVRE